MNDVQPEPTETDRAGSSMREKLTLVFAMAAVLFLALWAWTELRLRAEREITRSVEAEKSVLEGEAERRSGIRNRLRGRRTGIALDRLSKVAMSPVDESAEARGRVYVESGSGRVFGFFEGLDESRPGMTYQLWFRPAGAPPESVGTVAFDADGDGIVTSTGLPAENVTGEFVLTLEQAGGALVPTGPDILRGSLGPALPENTETAETNTPAE